MPLIRRVHIHETEVGLRYRRGRYKRQLGPGGHWLLGPGLRVERARGESAALRNLASAARLIDANPALMNLRLLQTIVQEPGVPGTTRFVVNLAGSGANGASDGDSG
jgi:hypothetical protein